jgi:hypothetical protein
VEHVELLDEAPGRLSRPLALVGGRAYAATWLHVRVHRELTGNSEAVGKRPILVSARATAVAAGGGDEGDGASSGAGALARVERTVETRTERRLNVVRDDGVVFGDGADRALEELGLEVGLVAPPRAERTWRRAGVEAYRRGERPEPGDVFGRLVACYDAFVDFGRSLAAQGTMCELWACLSLATWLTDAFTLVPYLWIAGERGCGSRACGTWARSGRAGGK